MAENEAKSEPEVCPRCGKALAECACAGREDKTPHRERVPWEEMADKDAPGEESSEEFEAEEEEAVRIPNIPEGPQEEIRFEEPAARDAEDVETPAPGKGCMRVAIIVVVVVLVVLGIIALVMLVR